ncbi:MULTISPECIES: alcohol dehydrogenase catalytic domain-containing protein [Brevibacterium]|uniref:alcohol dehydrogenase catalytic domain-containing protein n=1 Tax=Brevibacterium TaxID=1696 RepID=UPI001C68DD58|nr:MULTISPECIES: alcohol dehydrogenase catalytic domain-containing protein [Brevibacterium]
MEPARLRPHDFTPEPPEPGWVRVAVAACGMCRADLSTVESGAGDHPVIAGHEIAGTIAELGAGETGYTVGDRVAVGWFGGSCGACRNCRRGDVVHCPDRRIPGISYPGGWSESVTVPRSALARIPDALGFASAAPMGCAGVTMFNAARRIDAGPGAKVAVFGIGGLGHLGVQFATRMGYEVIAIARGRDREELARSLGAAVYLDSSDREPGQALRELGGVDAVISTAPAAEALGELARGLRAHGQLIITGTGAGDLELPVGAIVSNALRITGHLTGSPADIEDAMRFAVLHGIRPMVEERPLEEAQQGLEDLAASAPRFRAVLTTALGRGE